MANDTLILIAGAEGGGVTLSGDCTSAGFEYRMRIKPLSCSMGQRSGERLAQD